MPSEALVAKRQVEQQNAARILGVKEVIFLGCTNGELTPDQTLRKRLAKSYVNLGQNRATCGPAGSNLSAVMLLEYGRLLSQTVSSFICYINRCDTEGGGEK